MRSGSGRNLESWKGRWRDKLSRFIDKSGGWKKEMGYLLPYILVKVKDGPDAKASTAASANVWWPPAAILKWWLYNDAGCKVYPTRWGSYVGKTNRRI